MKIRNTVAAVMALCMMGGVIPAVCNTNVNVAVAADTEEKGVYTRVDDISYIVYSDHAEVNLFDFKREGDVVIPDTVEGVPVTVARGANGSGPHNVTSFKLPDTIEIIDDDTFEHCDKLTSINMPKNLKSIGKEAFHGCTGLTGFDLPEGLETIGESAFNTCTGITELTIPVKVKDIGAYAFANCENLEKLAFTGNDNVIGEKCCESDKKLTDITFAEGIWDFRYNALIDTPWLKTQIEQNEADNNSLVIVNNTIVDGRNCEGNVVIPENIKYIGEFAFSGAKNVSYVTIPSNVEMISKGAFWGCSMKELTIEDGVKTLGVNAFRACVNIPEVNVPDSVTSIGVGCFYDCSGMVKAHIPDAITEIPDSLFSGCDNLSEFELSKM